MHSSIHAYLNSCTRKNRNILNFKRISRTLEYADKSHLHPCRYWFREFFWMELQICDACWDAPGNQTAVVAAVSSSEQLESSSGTRMGCAWNKGLTSWWQHDHWPAPEWPVLVAPTTPDACAHQYYPFSPQNQQDNARRVHNRNLVKLSTGSKAI